MPGNAHIIVAEELRPPGEGPPLPAAPRLWSTFQNSMRNAKYCRGIRILILEYSYVVYVHWRSLSGR